MVQNANCGFSKVNEAPFRMKMCILSIRNVDFEMWISFMSFPHSVDMSGPQWRLTCYSICHRAKLGTSRTGSVINHAATLQLLLPCLVPPKLRWIRYEHLPLWIFNEFCKCIPESAKSVIFEQIQQGNNSQPSLALSYSTEFRVHFALQTRQKHTPAPPSGSRSTPS